MAFLHRLGYYLGGFSMGLIILFFIYNGKRTQCHYGPEARVLDNLSEKQWKAKTALLDGMTLDSLSVQKLLKTARVDFSKSNTQLDSCKTYALEGFFNDVKILWDVENCKKVVYITKIKAQP